MSGGGWWKKIAPYGDEDDRRVNDSPIKDSSQWGEGASFLDEIGHDDDEDNVLGHDYVHDHDDDDDGREEVKLTHETDNAAARATETIEASFATLQEQVNEFKGRFIKSQEELKRVLAEKGDLDDKVEVLEEENAKLNSAAGNAGAITMIGGRIGGGAGGPGGGHANLRNALMSVTEEMDLDIADNDSGDDSLMKRLKTWWLRNKPLQADIRRVSSRFGAGTTSYFIFYRFVYLQFSLLAMTSVAFSVLHLSYMVSSGTGYSDAIVTPGFLPYFMLYSSYATSEAFQYSLMVVLCIVVLLASVLEHLVNEDKNMKEVDALEVGNEIPYAKEVLCAWDFSVASQQEADDQYSSLANKYTAQLEETRTKGLKAARTRTDLFLLYSRRFVGLCLYLAVQAASFAAIIYLTISGDAVAEQLAGTPFASFAPSVAPGAIFVINSTVPPIMKFITKFEKWDTGMMYTSLLLGRQYLFTILNTIIFVVSILMLADPFFLSTYPTIRNALSAKDDNKFVCLIDTAADGLFALVVTGFAFKEVVTNFAMPQMKLIMAQITKKPVTKDPYDVVDSIIELLGFLGNILFVFPFAPLAMVFAPFMILFRIKRETAILMAFAAKPEKPWKAHYSGVIFTFVYLVTLFLTGLPAGIYFLSTKTFAKNCDIQDDYVNLCASSINPKTQTCVKSKSSAYYSLYSDKDYPAYFCKRACGAFVGQRFNFGPFKNAVTDISILGGIFDAAFSYPYVPWFFFCIALIVRATSANSRIVARTLQEKRDRMLESKIEILEKEKRKAEKLADRYKNQLGSVD